MESEKVHSRFDTATLDSGTLDSVGYHPKFHNNQDNNAAYNTNTGRVSSSSTLLRGFMTTVMEGRAGWDAAVEDLCVTLTSSCTSLDADEIISKIRDIVVETLRCVC